MKIIGYGLSGDKKGLLAFFHEERKSGKEGKISFYHIHSDEMTKKQEQIYTVLSTTPSDNKSDEANLGCATTGELIEEIKTRIEVDGKLDYRTIDS